MLLQPKYVGTGNVGFSCDRCGADTPPVTNGSYRNHCPHCLYSKHVDQSPGDRLSTCRGLMEPVGLAYHSRKGYQIIHRCTACGAVRRNRIVDSGDTPDQLDQLCAVAANPE